MTRSKPQRKCLGCGEMKDKSAHIRIVRGENGEYVLLGGLIDMLCRNVVLNNPDSMQYFQRVLRERGVIKALTEAGCKEGDTVVVGDVEFEFVL